MKAVTAAKRVSISSGGAATADIVVAKNAPRQAKYAAHALADFLGRVTGSKFRINRKPGKAKFHLLVGRGAAGFADPAFAAENLGPEGIILRTVGNNIIIAGGQPRGTLYAVFTFLEDYADCRWWSSKVSTIPEKPTLVLPPLQVCYIPPLEYHYPFWTDAFDPDWAIRNKSNGPDKLKNLKYGGHMTHGGGHTFYRLISPKKYFKDNPEWFSLIKRKRTHDRAQLCLTNQDMRKELIKNLKSWIRENPGQLVFSVSQNDWAGNCGCSKCRKLDAKAGSPAGSLLLFVNAVAEEIEEEFPHVSISTLAYQYTRKPPKNIRPRPNVIIQLCTIECSFSVPLTHKRNRKFRDDIVGWSRIADRLYIWDYVTNFSHHFLPHPNLRVLGPNIRFFVSHNTRGIFEQGAYATHGAEFAELRAWVLAKLLWDPKLNDKRLITEFCNGYYGLAGKYIVAYLKLTHDAVETTGDRLGCFSHPTEQKFLSFDLLNKGWNKLQGAERAVANDAVLLNRVKMVQLPVMYAFMSKWKALRAQCRAAKALWPMPEEIEALGAEFKRIAKANKVTRVNEWTEGFGLVDQAIETAKGKPKQ